MNLHKFGFKVRATKGLDIDPAQFIPVFHTWIRERTVPGVLIDVADYSHVADGPGIVLVGLEGIYSVDFTGGRMGFCYQARRPGSGTLAERLAYACHLTLVGAAELENHEQFRGHLEFSAGEIECFANDRLLVESEGDAGDGFLAELGELAARTYPKDGAAKLCERVDGRDRITAMLSGATEGVGLSDLALGLKG